MVTLATTFDVERNFLDSLMTIMRASFCGIFMLLITLPLPAISSGGANCSSPCPSSNSPTLCQYPSEHHRERREFNMRLSVPFVNLKIYIPRGDSADSVKSGSQQTPQITRLTSEENCRTIFPQPPPRNSNIVIA
ncbi:hypothetical protein BIW11_06442 [Tropilaelaps mercedesae]|uniref:Uncharacterized protein n=1 Tax=Tropilaelaps mercedesae TaxID=418985 RepID=A0A1V9XY50_9ACAR|nr:hypothetical protein BIW11_06442 [Tropilaelaps mercedesae]